MNATCLEVPTWTADLFQVLNSGPFYHDQQIYLLPMFHIFMCRCTATSLSSPSYVKKTICDSLGKSLHHHELFQNMVKMIYFHRFLKAIDGVLAMRGGQPLAQDFAVSRLSWAQGRCAEGDDEADALLVKKDQLALLEPLVLSSLLVNGVTSSAKRIVCGEEEWSVERRERMFSNQVWESAY